MAGGAEPTPHPLDTVGLGWYILDGRSEGLLYNIESSTDITINTDITSTLRTGVLTMATAQYNPGEGDGWICIINVGGFVQFDAVSGPTYTDIAQYTCIDSGLNDVDIVNKTFTNPTFVPTMEPTAVWSEATETKNSNDTIEYLKKEENNGLNNIWIIIIAGTGGILFCVCITCLVMKLCMRNRLQNQTREDTGEEDITFMIAK